MQEGVIVGFTHAWFTILCPLGQFKATQVCVEGVLVKSAKHFWSYAQFELELQEGLVGGGKGMGWLQRDMSTLVFPETQLPLKAT